LLCGDPAPDHAAALLRVVGSHNSKYGEPRLCRVVQPGEPVDITEIEELINLLADRPLFESLPKTTTNGHDKTEPRSAMADNEPIDVDARLAGMKFHGAGDSAIHLTQLSVTASLLRAGVSLLEATRTVLEATRTTAANDPGWEG
jgi:hypothetical protein